MPAITTIQLRRDTAANWTSTNPTLAAGELGFESDTFKFKIGNGSLAWTALSYGASGTANTATNLAGGAAGSLPYQSGAGATTFLAAGATNKLLAYGGSSPVWVTPDLTYLANFSSANLATAMLDKTGTGLNVFATSPSLTTPTIAGATVSGTVAFGTTTFTGNLTGSGTTQITATAFVGSLTGNASTASSAAKLTTARTINGVSFDGSANLTQLPPNIQNSLGAYSYTTVRPAGNGAPSGPSYGDVWISY